MRKLKQFLADFGEQESGAQVVEYALLIAMVSIVLVLALASNTDNGLQGGFDLLVERVTSCLRDGSCTVVGS